MRASDNERLFDALVTSMDEYFYLLFSDYRQYIMIARFVSHIRHTYVHQCFNTFRLLTASGIGSV